MKQIRTAIFGIVSAFATGFVVIAALSLGLMENRIIPQAVVTLPPTLPAPNLTPIPGSIQTATLGATLTQPIPSATICPPPVGWLPYLVQAGDTLRSLSLQYGISVDEIMRGNCLVSDTLFYDAQIFLPPQPTASASPQPQQPSPTLTTVACGRPPGWIAYRVRVGDTLTRISILYRVSVYELMFANCLSSNLILAGSNLWVPNVIPSTPTFTPTARASATNEPPLPTRTFTPTGTSTQSDTSTPTATETPVNTATSSATGTPTPTTPPSTPTSTPTPTSTETPLIETTLGANTRVTNRIRN